MKDINKALMATALIFSQQSYAERKKVGAVLSREGRIIACGYNGTLPGIENKCEVETECLDCFEGFVGDNEICNKCNGTGKIVETSEFVLHAEQNLLMFCAKEGLKTKDSNLYVTMAPCKTCAKLIVAAGIKKVFYNETYRDMSGVEFLVNLGIDVVLL